VTGIWVVAELDAGGGLDPAALGLLTRARALSADLTAVALGPGASTAVEALAEHGAAAVLVSDDPVFAEYPGEPAAHVLGELVRRHGPELVLFGSSYDSRDVASRLQALLGVSLVAGVDELLATDRLRVSVALSLWPGRPGNLRGGIGGTKHVEVALTGDRPGLALVRTGAFAAEPCGGSATVLEVGVRVPDERRRVRRVERHEDRGDSFGLESAPVVVAGGRGLGRPEAFSLLDDLARAIGSAAVGATRPVVDAGWAPFSRQIGQTGKTVQPSVYIAVGISGAAQHVVGVRRAQRIIAINTDPAAPIFQLADLGVVGDALAVVPAVIDRLAARRGAS
jgi:electron transfer flavoprotein alpha subunit